MAAIAQAAAVAAPAALAAGSGRSSRSGNAVALKAPMFAGKSEFAAKTVSNGSRVSCMKVWTPVNNPRFETLSYLPPLSPEGISKQIDYMLSKGWVPCLEFDMGGTVYREHNSSPGYYDGRYWTMWKLPMFGCNSASQVLGEIEEAKRAYPRAYIRVLGFDNVRQVQCAGFLVHKPGQY